jgi:arylamine N-acetyltransferase
MQRKLSTSCCLVTRMQEKIVNIKIANRSFENVAKFTHLETKITNKNLFNKVINDRLNSGNACYHSIHKFLVFSSAV